MKFNWLDFRSFFWAMLDEILLWISGDFFGGGGFGDVFDCFWLVLFLGLSWSLDC